MAMYLNSFANIPTLNSNATLSPFVRFQFALSSPNIQRCQELSTFIEEASIKDLQGLFPVLVENMFGFGNQQGWGFRTVCRASQSREFDAFRQFLSPSGPMLRLVYKLMSDSCLRYEFPVACLPAPTRRVLEEGIIPLLYVNKLQMPTPGRLPATLSLNAFEFYFFQFAYYLVNPYAQKNSANWTSPGEIVYQTVVDDYFQYFLPADGSSVPPLSLVISSRSSLSPYGLVDRSSLSSSLEYSGNSGPYNSQPRSSRSLGLLKHISLKKVTASPPLQLPEHSFIETWRSEAIAQIFSEFWLNQNTSESHGISIPSVTQSQLFRFGAYAPSAGMSLVSDFTGIDSYSSLSFCFAEMFNPNYDHVRIVRMLIKHLHYFANSFTEGSLNPIEELKRNIISILVQEKLYSFLHYMIAHWPLDASFRLVLETWLSYIQPWRYLDIRASYSQSEKLEEKEKNIDLYWQKFVTENLAFYTIIFQQMLPRFFRMDLSTPKNAYMLYRVTKVYSQPNLSSMIAEAEASLQEPLTRSGRISVGQNKESHSGSYISSSSVLNPGTAAMVRQQLIELEGPGFQYIPLFGEDVWLQVLHLLRAISQAQEAIRQMQKVPDHMAKGFLRSLKALFLSLFDSDYLNNPDDYSASDINKVEVHLAVAANQLRRLFKIQAPDSSIFYPNESAMLNYTNVFTGALPSFEALNDTLEPTSSKLKNGVCRTDLKFEGNPDLQPIRSYEIPFLVRQLYQLCSVFNEKYRTELCHYYHRRDFIGQLCKQFLASPKIYYTYNKSSQLSPRQQQVLPPRINLRFLANKQLLRFIVITLIVAYYFGLHPVLALFILFLFPVLCAVIKAAFSCFQTYLR